jgi:hypothetical protein
MTERQLREYAAEQRELAAKAVAAGWVAGDMDTVAPGTALYGSFFADTEDCRKGMAAYRAAQDRFDRLLASAAVTETAPHQRRSDEIAGGPARAATVSPIASAVRSNTAPATVVAPAISLSPEEKNAALLVGVAESKLLDEKRRLAAGPTSMLSAVERAAARALGLAEGAVVAERRRQANPSVSKLTPAEARAARALGLTEDAVLGQKRRMGKP